MTDPHVIWLRDKSIERYLKAKAVKTVDRIRQSGELYSNGLADVVDSLDRAVTIAADSAVADHIAMNDPLTVVETCLAELGILGEHASIDARAPSGATQPQCRTCKTAYPCRTVRRLHNGYRPFSPW